MPKIITYYLPQYHRIPENDKWWGDGFTEWENVRKAVQLFPDHNQPRVPLNNNYYDLTDKVNIKWQATIAKENGVYGFCFYHYWFSDKPFMDKPLKLFLDDKSIDIKFCLCWANESWTNGWAKSEASVIMEQKYGDKEEWKRHFLFLLPFLKDERYIKENNTPLIVIYRPYLFEKMKEMLEFWDQLARENGFSGLRFASQRYEDSSENEKLYNYLNYHIEYQPNTVRKLLAPKVSTYKKIRKMGHDIIYKLFNKDLSFHQRINGPFKEDYDLFWKKIVSMHPESPKSIAGAFVDWDNTPRHGRRGSVMVGKSPEKFHKYLFEQLIHIKKEYTNDYLFMFAWNEWGEGGYLEPDSRNKYEFLNAIKMAIKESENVEEASLKN